MSNAARKYITNYCLENLLTAAKFEKKVGAEKDAIYSFLVFRVPDLKLNTAVKIADALLISLDELVDRQEAVQKFPPTIDKNIEYKSKLMSEILSYIKQHAESNPNCQYRYREVMRVINEIYEYSIHLNLDHIDKKFAQWCCQNKSVLPSAKF